MKLLRRHATWITLSLIACALLPASASAQPRVHRPGELLTAGLDSTPGSTPIWLTPTFVAGVAALMVALADGISKVVLACRRDTSLEVCPFAVAGVSLCYGRSAAPPAPPVPLPPVRPD